MPVPVTIPVALFEVSIAYVRPVISLWLDRATIVQAMFDFFEPSLLNVDDIEAITTGKSSEQGFKFKLT